MKVINYLLYIRSCIKYLLEVGNIYFQNNKILLSMDNKIKIICFHGYGTNAELMKYQMRHLQKSLDKFADFYYPNGVKQVTKSLITDDSLHNLIQGSHYTWFDHRNKSQSEIIKVMLKKIIKQINQNGPFDGMIGFSQGGLVAYLIAKILKQKRFGYQKFQNMKFAIFICSPVLDWHTLDKKQQLKPVEFPNLHILSENDFLFPFSITLTTKFIGPSIIFHLEGHKIPKFNYSENQQIKKFIVNSINQKHSILQTSASKL